MTIGPIRLFISFYKRAPFLYLFGQIQTSQTGGQPHSDTSPYSECSLKNALPNVITYQLFAHSMWSGRHDQHLKKSNFGAKMNVFLKMVPKRTSSSVWPYLAKFRHFDNNLKVFGIWIRVYFVFGQNFETSLANWELFQCHEWPKKL